MSDQAAVTMYPLNSSYLMGVGRDGEDLLVQFKSNGKTFRYKDGGKHLEAMRKSESSGKYFHAHVKGEHQASEVK
jgi:hypothetical protein